MAMKLMFGHVKYTLKASMVERDEMSRGAEAAGIGWGEMVTLAEQVAVARSIAATDAAVKEMAGWSAEQWAEAKARFALSFA